jgi:hypothetical protein
MRLHTTFHVAIHLSVFRRHLALHNRGHFVAFYNRQISGSFSKGQGSPSELQ